MRSGLLLILLLTAKQTLAQSCSCLDDFHFIKAHIEKNHGGFNKKIKSPEEQSYKAFTDKLENEIRTDNEGKYCIAYLKKYILFLQDHHSNITGPSAAIKEDSAAALEAFFKSPIYSNTETISIRDEEILKKLEPDAQGVEGIYYTVDSTYKIGIIKNKTERRDYVGIILQSKTKLWSKGQVKLELKMMNDSVMEVYTYLRNHSLNYDQVTYKNGELQLTGWNRAGKKASPNQPAISSELISFKVLDSVTTLLGIRSFDASVYKKLDSTYREVIPIIRKYPYLIIDVRNNGGGADQSYMALMPLIYTDPYESDVVEIYNTAGNIKAYQDYDDRQRQNTTARQNVFKANIDKMKTATPNSFVPMGDGSPRRISYPKNAGRLEKIAVLYNRNCASSCESLLFEVMNSKKAIMVGENSGGYTGYGNVMSVTTPCGNQLYWTTTVYRNQWKYEFVGIPPQYKVPADELDWVEYTRKLLKY